jgi:hypothetical protein
MTPKIFDINEFIQLQYDNEIWNLYIQGELANLEEFLDKNSSPKLVTAIKEIMKNEVDPVEDTEEAPIVDDQPKEEPHVSEDCFFETECFDPLKGKESCNGYYPEDEGDDLK